VIALQRLGQRIDISQPRLVGDLLELPDLNPPEVGVQALCRHEIIVITALGDLPVFYYEDFVGIANA